MSMIFEGEPVYLEFANDGRPFTLITETWERQRTDVSWLYAAGTPDPFPRYHEYDLNWCDSHDHYHAQASGNTRFPHILMSRCTYWIAPPLQVEGYAGAPLPEGCLPLTEASQLVPLLLSTPEAFLSLHPEGFTVGILLAYWEMEANGVEEGEIIYCSLCTHSYDYEAILPCPHLDWCETCGEWSVPQGDCPHRSADDTSYVAPPDDDDERKEEENV